MSDNALVSLRIERFFDERCSTSGLAVNNDFGFRVAYFFGDFKFDPAAWDPDRIRNMPKFVFVFGSHIDQYQVRIFGLSLLNICVPNKFDPIFRRCDNRVAGHGFICIRGPSENHERAID